MPVLEISLDQTLIHFLPDDGELYGGMYLASAYRNIIDWQNSFINIVIGSIGPHSVLKSYLSQLNQEINVHEATEEDLLKINDETYNKVKGMIKQYSMRDIFKNGKIDFEGFKKSIKYDFDSIESELGRTILPGLKKFLSAEEDEPIRFVTYLYEAFRSSRSSIITNYNKKYPSRELTENERKLLYSFINESNETQNFSKDILVSCQILIDFIQKENFNKNEPIISVIGKLPKYIEIDEFLRMFFINNNGKDSNNNNFAMFSINILINIYNLIEFICWNQFKDNLNDQYYRMHLEGDAKKAIKEYFETEINENSLIKKQDIADAVRRLISRYLSGKRNDTDISEYKKLFDYIQREDLWKTDLSNDDNFKSELSNIFEGIKKVANIIVLCNENDNKCDNCWNFKTQGNENPCKECENCKCGLRIGHALEFYELINGFINEEATNSNKDNVKKDINNDKRKDFEINTNSNQENEEDKEQENENNNGEESEEENEEKSEEI